MESFKTLLFKSKGEMLFILSNATRTVLASNLKMAHWLLFNVISIGGNIYVLGNKYDLCLITS